MSRRNHCRPEVENTYFKILATIHICVSILFFILHLILIDTVNVLMNIEGLNLSNINEYLAFSGQIAIIIILSFILGFSILSMFLEKSYTQGWHKLIFAIALISFLLLSIISIINTFDIAKMFFEENPIDVVNLYPSETPIFIFRALMICLFVVIILLLNTGLLLFIHEKLPHLKRDVPLPVFLLILFIFNFSIIGLFFTI